ncbi:ATP-dependent helicase [Escherichia coli]|nr:ATP-dependent helicase [Escherichia coli]
MPGRTPGHRTPLWQQRLRASQLLEIAQGYPDFPVILETLRECLQDVYDLPALERLMRRLNGGEIQISDVTTTTPSPFATVYCSAMSRNLCTRATPRWQSAGIRTVAGQRVTAQSTRTGRSGGITRPAGHSPGGRRVATTGSWQKSER